MTQARDGPVQFEKESADPFNIDEMIRDVTSGNKKHGLQNVDSRTAKRPRINGDNDDEST